MSEGQPPFSSIEEMRTEHVELMRKCRGLAKTPWGDIEAFAGRAYQTGTLLQGTEERDLAQAMLDYWSALLLTAPDTDDLAVCYTLAPFDPEAAPELPPDASPFVGLNSFLESDSARFRGRERASDELAARIASERLIIVHGPSGSGKSSLVNAGLVPRLRAGGAEGSSAWHYYKTMQPGTDPMSALVQLLAPAGDDRVNWVTRMVAQLSKAPDLVRVALPGNATALLIVDQFEELFTLTPDAARDDFCAVLRSIVATPAPLHRVVVLVREDFTKRTVAALDGDRAGSDALIQFDPGMMSRSDLARAIVEPAAQVGLKFDEGLVEELVAQVADEPAALPLLQFALTQLWRHKQRDRITWEIYRKVGSPAEALASEAERVYADLKIKENQSAAEIVLTRLVQPAEAGSIGAEFVRRRLRRETLHQLLASNRVDLVIDHFSKAGLVRVTPGETRADDLVEVAHEALIRNWPRLSEWLELRRTEIERERRLLAARNLWEESGRRTDYLLTGVAIDDAERSPSASGELSEFIAVSKRHSQRRTSIMATIATIAAVVLFGLLLYAFIANRLKTDALAKETQALKMERQAIDQASSSARVGSTAEVRTREAEQALRDIVLRYNVPIDQLPASLHDIVLPTQKFDFSAPVQAFDPLFLGRPLPFNSRWENDRFKVLDYTHFLIVFDSEIGVPLFSISNLDRDKAVGPIPPARPYFDLRAPNQILERDLAALGMARGQLVSWAEVGWGSIAAQTDVGRGVNAMTNIIPMRKTARDAAMADAWAKIGAWMLVRHNPAARQVMILSGYKPAVADRFATPALLWKIAVSPSADRSATWNVDAAMLPAGAPQGNDLLGRTTVAAIEKATNLNFGSLRDATTGVGAPIPTAGVAQQQRAVRIFVQYRGLSSDQLDGVRDALRSQGFQLPKAELKPQTDYDREVRYYFPEDQASAKASAETARTALKALGFGDRPVDVRRLSPRRFPAARPRTIELWIVGK